MRSNAPHLATDNASSQLVDQDRVGQPLNPDPVRVGRPTFTAIGTVTAIAWKNHTNCRPGTTKHDRGYSRAPALATRTADTARATGNRTCVIDVGNASG